jgi:hypothetical protein
MSTPTVTPIVTQLHPISTYLKAHEHLLIVLVLVVLSWFALGKVQSVLAAHDNANLAQAKVTAAVQQEKNDALAKQIAQQAAEYKALADKVNAQNAALEQANVNLANALIKQQRTDASLPPSELANRWTVLVPQAKPVVTPTGIAVDTPSAVATVQALEETPALRAQLSNERTQLENAQKLIVDEGTQIATLNTLVTGKDALLADDAKVCSAQVAVVKADARKSKRKWFIVGVVVGWVGRQLLKTETGI